MNCSNKNNAEINLYKDIVLGESYFSNGQIKTRVIKGRTPGEDPMLAQVCNLCLYLNSHHHL